MSDFKPTRAADEEEQAALLAGLPEHHVEKYLSDGLQGLLTTHFENHYSHLKIPNADRHLLYEIHAFLRKLEKARAKGGRPKRWESLQQKNKHYNDLRRGKK